MISIPRYKFKCKECDKEYIKYFKINDEKNVICECGEECSQVIGLPLIQFKGDGFYANGGD